MSYTFLLLLLSANLVLPINIESIPPPAAPTTQIQKLKNYSLKPPKTKNQIRSALVN